MSSGEKTCSHVAIEKTVETRDIILLGRSVELSSKAPEELFFIPKTSVQYYNTFQGEHNLVRHA